MSFWHQQQMQPKRNYRFRIKISVLKWDGQPASVIWWVKNFKPPSYTLSEATHDYMDNKYYWPGRVTWEDCTMQLVDPISPNAAELPNQIIIDSGYLIKTDTTKEQSRTIGKDQSVSMNGNVEVEVLRADGSVVESWVMKNSWMKGASWSNLDYTSDDLRTIDVTWRYDWATCTHYDEKGVPRKDQFEAGKPEKLPTPTTAQS